MYAEERQAAIANLISETGRVAVTKIADAFNVTPETVRRDLDVLEQAGVVRRVHGGALPANAFTHLESGIAERESLHTDGKERIARTALRYLPSLHGSLSIDGGTTTSRLVNSLFTESFTVVTNSIPVLNRLSTSPSVKLHAIGGRVRHETAAIVGGTATAEVLSMRVDVAFLGTNGLSLDHGLSTPDLDEAAMKRAFVKAAKLRVLLTDSSKFGVQHVHRFADLQDIDILITDAEPPADIAAALQEHEIEVVVA